MILNYKQHLYGIKNHREIFTAFFLARIDEKPLREIGFLHPVFVVLNYNIIGAVRLTDSGFQRIYNSSLPYARLYAILKKR